MRTQAKTPLHPGRLPLSDAAILANVSPNTIRRWIADRLLPGVRVGSRLFIERADLEEFLRGEPVACDSSAPAEVPAGAN